jgi:putative Mg2+ transporter-C (MgtC) family protein
MNWELEWLYVMRTIIAAILGGLVGWERERYNKTEAGIRTHIAVCIGSCTFALVSSHIPGADPSRIASQIVVGIGFLGAGVILHEKGKVSGLTTAAALWAMAAVGTAVGYGMYILAVLNTLIIYFTLAAHRLPFWKKIAHKSSREGGE